MASISVLSEVFQCADTQGEAKGVKSVIFFPKHMTFYISFVNKY
jgi:hypothetical protein